MLQVCSPETMADVYTSCWPHWPDKTDMLRQVAEAAP